MSRALEDRTTISSNIWSVFTDMIAATLLIMVFFIFVQFVANSRALVQLLIKNKQAEMATRIRAELADDWTYLTEIADGNLQRFRFSSAILFDSASDELKDTGRRVLGKLGNALNHPEQLFDEILIEGHTDNRNIRTSRFPSNWELSSARATAVVRFLEDSASVDPHKLKISSVGKSQYIPASEQPEPDSASTEDLEAWLQLNRRIEIVLVYSESSAWE